MPAIHVRDVDDAVLDALRARAARSHRSLQGEIRAILEKAARGPRTYSGRPKGLRLRTVSLGAKVRYSRDEIYEDEKR